MTPRPRDFPIGHDGKTSIADDGRAVLSFERHLRHPVERVWDAITEPDEMTAWLAYRAEIDPQVGGRLLLWLGDSRSESPILTGTISVFDPGATLEAAFDDGSVLRFEVRESTDGCVLTFSDTRPVGQRAQNSVLAGWHLRMDQLPDALTGSPTDWLALDTTRDEHGFVAAIAEIYWHYRNQTRVTT